jgi:hypothetical protein
MEYKWTTEKPDKDGWYWAYAQNLKLAVCVKVEIIQGELWIEHYVEGYDFERDFYPKDITHWIGPIPVPHLPQVNEARNDQTFYRD